MNQEVFPFAQREAAIKRRQAMLAQAMRDQIQQRDLPGQMISGHYVAPSWAQNLNNVLAPVMDRRRIDQMGNAIDADVGAFDAADRKAAIEHAMGRPQATPAQHTLPPDQAGPSIPAQAPTQNQMAAWAQQGAGIPSRKGVIEKVMADIEVNAPIREEAKIERGEQLAADRVARSEDRKAALEARAEELRLRLQDRGLDRASREQMAAEQRSLTKTIADMSNATRREVIAAGLNKAEGGPKGKTLPAGTVKDLGDLDERAATLASVSSSFKPEYAGPVAAAKGTVSSYVPGMDTAGANWWRNYKKQQELVERHSLFGATLTAGEQSAWRAADISPAMQPEVIQKNLATRARLAEKVAAKALERYGASGYNVEGLGRVRSTGGASGDFGGGGVPTTKTIGGKTYVQRNGQWFEQ